MIRILSQGRPIAGGGFIWRGEAPAEQIALEHPQPHPGPVRQRSLQLRVEDPDRHLPLSGVAEQGEAGPERGAQLWGVLVGSLEGHEGLPAILQLQADQAQLGVEGGQRHRITAALSEAALNLVLKALGLVGGIGALRVDGVGDSVGGGDGDRRWGGDVFFHTAHRWAASRSMKWSDRRCRSFGPLIMRESGASKEGPSQDRAGSGQWTVGGCPEYGSCNPRGR